MVEMVESEVRRESEQREKPVVFDSDEQSWNKLQHENQGHKKRIKDLVGLASETRARIDALLGRKTTSRIEYEDNFTDTRRGSRDSRGSDIDRVDSERALDSERRSSRTIAIKNDGSGGNVSINMTAVSPPAESVKASPPPPKVKPKPPRPGATKTTVEASPRLIKKPFKFGTVSLQVKLDD